MGDYCGCGHKTWEEHRAAIIAEYGFYPPDRDVIQYQGSPDFRIEGNVLPRG